MAYQAPHEAAARTAERASGRLEPTADGHAGTIAKQTEDEHSARQTPGDFLRTCAQLWPLVVGLAFGRAGLIVASYGSYTSTDEGIFTDGAMLVTLSLSLIHISSSAPKLIARCCNDF